MSKERIERITNSLGDETYKPKPVRRVYIPKPDGRQRPLGIPSGDDKLVQGVCKIILERIYEPVSSNFSHGYRPDRSSHTALEQVKKTWTGLKWFLEFDVRGFFDNMNHETMTTILEKKIDDKRFIKLVKKLMKAGYLEDWTYNATRSGVPQGGIISPILSNIYLNELDEFVEQCINEFNKGKERTQNPEYGKLTQEKSRLRLRINEEGKKPNLMKEYNELDRLQKTIPSKTNSDKYKRMRYCRYADDFIIGMIGSKQDAKDAMLRIIEFLNKYLNLEVSPEKTQIEKGKKGINFLSYQINMRTTDKLVKSKYGRVYATRRTVRERVSLSVPNDKARIFCNKNRYGIWNEYKPLHRPELIQGSDLEIVTTCNSELRGLANYYSLADDVKEKLKWANYLSLYSLFKTLSAKHKSSMSATIRTLKVGNEYFHRYKVKGEWKSTRIFQLKHMEKGIRKWDIDLIPVKLYLTAFTSELIRRMEAETCEYCERAHVPVQVHHVRKLKDLKKKSNLQLWEKVMIARSRKTIILCSDGKDSCHSLLHAGKLPDNRFSQELRTSKI